MTSLETVQPFSTRQAAIEELHTWVRCPKDQRLAQIFSVREHRASKHYELLCGHGFSEIDGRWTRNVEQTGHNAETHLTFETYDPVGRQVEQFTQWGRSFLLQYYQFVSLLTSAIWNSTLVTQTANDTGGAGRTVPNTASTTLAASGMACGAPSTTTTYGLVAGTSSTANTAGQSALNTLIANGSGAGQLNYGATSVSYASGSTPCAFTIVRNLGNASGGSITVNEAGVYGATEDSGVSERFLAYIRDYNAAGLVTITNGNNSTCTYTLSYTIS